MLPNQAARRVAEWWARIVFLDDDAGGHVSLVLVHTYHHDRQGTVCLGPEIEANAGATGLTAGSDRQPPGRLTNRLWIAESQGNKIAFMSFK